MKTVTDAGWGVLAPVWKGVAPGVGTESICTRTAL